jgi:glycosyltransferase involved in cell wall biosynthesis
MKSVALIVLNNFQNDSRVLKEAISLKQNNFKVSVVALHENDCLEEEVVEGINVRRIKLYTKAWPKNKIIQLVKYFEFLFRAILIVKTKTFVHCNDLKALPVGFFVKKFFNSQVKIVYDAHEYESEINGYSNFERKTTYFLEKLLIKSADVVFTVSASIASEYKRIYDIEKPLLILNAPAYKEIKKDKKANNLFRQKFNISDDQKIFISQGGLSVGRGIETMLVAFDHLNDEYKKRNEPSPVIVFMGYGTLEPLILKYVNRCDNIFFQPAVKIHEVIDYTKNADYGLLFIENTCLSYYYCMPNKIFEYLMAEIPVVVSNLKEVKSFVNKKQVGEVAEFNDVYGLIAALKKMLMQEKDIYYQNIIAVKKEYNWESQEKKMIEAYHNL